MKTQISAQNYVPPAELWEKPIALDAWDEEFFSNTAPAPELLSALFIIPLVRPGLSRLWRNSGDAAKPTSQAVDLKKWERSLAQADSLRREGRYEAAHESLLNLRKSLAAEYKNLGQGPGDPLLIFWDEQVTPLEAKVQYSWKKLENEAAVLEAKIGNQDLKRVPVLIRRLKKVREGIAQLARMAQELPLKSLAHGEWPEDFRGRLIEFYLSPKQAGREELDREWQTLVGLQEFESQQAFYFEQLTKVVPANSIFFGSPKATSETEQDLDRKAGTLWNPDYSRKSPLEIPRSELENTAFFRRLRELGENDPEQTAAIERGLATLMQGETFKQNAFRLRSPAPRLSQGIQNLFRAPLPPGTPLWVFEAWWKTQEADLHALKTFLEAVAHEEEVAEIAKSPSSQIQYAVQFNRQFSFLEQAAAMGTGVDFDLVKRDLLRHTEVLRAVEQEKLEALRKKFLSGLPDKVQRSFQEEGAWERFREIEEQALWFQVLSPAYQVDWKRSLLSILPNAKFQFGTDLSPALWVASDPNWAAILKQEAKIEAFEQEAALILQGVMEAETLPEALQAGLPLEEKFNALLLDAVDTLKGQAEYLAKGGSASVSQRYREEVATIQAKAQKISAMDHTEFRGQLAMSWLADVQIFVLGINIRQEIELMRALKDADLRWGALKNTAWHFTPFVATEDYGSRTQENFEENYLQHLLKAKAAYDRGEYPEAMPAFNALQGSPQRRINLERGASSARWSGLSIGIGIVAISALTAGVATEALLPVGVEGVGFALSAARFVTNASVFWATDRFLNSQVNDQPLLGSSKSAAGKAGELVESYFENLLMFGFLSGAGKAYQGLLFRVMTPQAERIAIQMGQEVSPGMKLRPGDFSKLPAEVQARLVRQAFQNLRWKGKSAVALGANANTWLSLNLWSAITDANYDLFSWQTQEDLVIFLAGLKLAHPLTEAVQQHLGMRKIRDAQKIMAEVELVDQQGLEWAEAFRRYQEEKKGDGEGLLLTLAELHHRRLTLMNKLPQLFSEEIRSQTEREFQAFEWEMRKILRSQGRENLIQFAGDIATYEPGRAFELLDYLPKAMGEGGALNQRVCIEILDNGVIEIDVIANDGPHGYIFPTTRILPTRWMNPVEVAALRKGLPASNRYDSTLEAIPAPDAGPARPPIKTNPKIWN